MDEDSSDDSDYNPDDEVNKSDIEEDDEFTPLAEISTSRKRHISSIFSELQESENSYVTSKISKAVGYSSNATKRNSNSVNDVSKLTESSREKSMDALAIIFGKKKARKLLGGASINDKNVANSVDQPGAVEDASPAHANILEIVKNTQRKIVVEDTKKFAGAAVT
jgi:hypothetical protein